MRDDVLFFDVETASADLLYTTPPEEFVRLSGYAWGSGPVQLTTDLEEIRTKIRAARTVVGHNIHQFDMTAVFGVHSTEPMHMALDGRMFDTWTDAPIVYPYPNRYTDRFGKERFISTPRQAMSFYGLDELAHQLGTSPKTHDLKALAKLHGGFDQIPVDDPDYRAYLVGDVEASRDLAEALLRLSPWNAYRAREQRLHGILAQCSRNGIVIDVNAARARIDLLTARKDHHLDMLHDLYGMPTDGKAPLRTNAGKQAVLAALESVGITADELPRTKNGAPSLGGDGIVEAAESKSEEAQQLARSLAAISGARMTAETLLNNTHADGRIHPSITALQRSARFSFQNPGLTVIGARGEGAQDKRLVAASPGCKLVEFDFSAADTRAVAAYSGDELFYRDYVEGDAHNTAAALVWGDQPLDDHGHHPMRQAAKMANHSSAYRIGARRLSAQAGIPIEDAQRFLDTQKQTYRKRFEWQERVTKEGERGYVVTHWGRALPVDRDRAYTQSAAQYGQNATREMLVDGLLACPRDVAAMVTGIVHDAVLWDIPADRVDEVCATITSCFEQTFHPTGGIPVPFPMASGTPGDNWFEASH